MLIWEQYDNVTWGVEWGSLLALIKETELAGPEYTAVCGTVSEAMHVLHDTELKNIQARAVRALIVLHNKADIDRLKI